MEALEQLKSVLCDPEGNVCISGSDGDRKVISDALESLEQQVAALKYDLLVQTESCKQLGRIAAEKDDERIHFRDQVAVLTKERDEDALLQPRITMSNLEMASALAAAQAREAKLREALAMIHLMGMHQNDRTTAQEALALHADDSALQARLKEERERCIAVCEETADIYRQMHNPEAENVADACADAIRGLA